MAAFSGRAPPADSKRIRAMRKALKKPLKRSRSMTENNEYFVEAVIAERADANGEPEYLVKWDGYPVDESVWLPKKDINPPVLAAWRQDKAILDALDDETEDEAEAVIGERTNANGEPEYLVKWDGVPVDESVWLTAKDINPAAVAVWHRDKSALDALDDASDDEIMQPADDRVRELSMVDEAQETGESASNTRPLKQNEAGDDLTNKNRNDDLSDRETAREPATADTSPPSVRSDADSSWHLEHTDPVDEAIKQFCHDWPDWAHALTYEEIKEILSADF